MRIFLVDDEKEIADLIELYLRNDGFDVIKCSDGKTALEKIRTEVFDLAILDVMLPDVDGFTLCREIRKKYNFPVIMLTARTSDADKISGLTLGADDYVTKPFNPLELLARVKAQIRRFYQYNTTDADKDIIEISGLEVDTAKHICRLYGEVLDFTPIEFRIVHMLCKNAGNVVSTQELFESVWEVAISHPHTHLLPFGIANIVLSVYNLQGAICMDNHLSLVAMAYVQKMDIYPCIYL